MKCQHRSEEQHPSAAMDARKQSHQYDNMAI
jgi:hypothetical protein